MVPLSHFHQSYLEGACLDMPLVDVVLIPRGEAAFWFHPPSEQLVCSGSQCEDHSVRTSPMRFVGGSLMSPDSNQMSQCIRMRSSLWQCDPSPAWSWASIPVKASDNWKRERAYILAYTCISRLNWNSGSWPKRIEREQSSSANGVHTHNRAVGIFKVGGASLI